MALDLGDLNEFWDGGMYATVRSKAHPGGKRYRIPPVPGDLGLWGRRVAALRNVDDDTTEEQLQKLAADIGEPPIPEGQTVEQAMLSVELHAEVLADGVDDEMIKHMAKIVFNRIVGGDALALAIAHGDDPKAGNREQRRAAAKTAKKTPEPASGSRTTSTAAAPTTRKAASGSGTRSQKPSAANAKPASRGRKS